MKHFIDLKTLEIKDAFIGAVAAYFPAAYLTLAYIELKAGAEIPLHNHIQEAVDIVLEELEMRVNAA